MVAQIVGLMMDLMVMYRAMAKMGVKAKAGAQRQRSFLLTQQRNRVKARAGIFLD
jgi:hypothetical protein